MSFLFKLRKIIHTTPILRQVSQTYASAFGMGKAYEEFDAKIGMSESGEPVPETTGSIGFGQADLAEWGRRNYPNTAALLDNYRQNYPSLRGQRYIEPEPEAFDEDYGDEE